MSDESAYKVADKLHKTYQNRVMVHYKGGVYQIVAICLDESDGLCVVYRPYEGLASVREMRDQAHFVQPLSRFFGCVVVKAGVVRRFTCQELAGCAVGTTERCGFGGDEANTPDDTEDDGDVGVRPVAVQDDGIIDGSFLEPDVNRYRGITMPDTSEDDGWVEGYPARPEKVDWRDERDWYEFELTDGQIIRGCQTRDGYTYATKRYQRPDQEGNHWSGIYQGDVVRYRPIATPDTSEDDTGGWVEGYPIEIEEGATFDFELTNGQVLRCTIIAEDEDEDEDDGALDAVPTTSGYYCRPYSNMKAFSPVIYEEDVVRHKFVSKKEGDTSDADADGWVEGWPEDVEEEERVDFELTDGRVIRAYFDDDLDAKSLNGCYRKPGEADIFTYRVFRKDVVRYKPVPKEGEQDER
jgi:hypothetical protein